MLEWYWILLIVLVSLVVVGVAVYFGIFYDTGSDPFKPVDIPDQFLPELYQVVPTTTNPDIKVPSLSLKSSSNVTPETTGVYVKVSDSLSLYLETNEWKCYKDNSLLMTVRFPDASGSIGKFIVFTEYASNYHYFSGQIGDEIYSMYFNGYTWVTFQTILEIQAKQLTYSTQSGSSQLYATIDPPVGKTEPIIKHYILSSDEWVEVDDVRPFKTVTTTYGSHISAYRDLFFTTDEKDILVFENNDYKQKLTLPTTVTASVYDNTRQILFVSHGQDITGFCLTNNSFTKCYTQSVSSTARNLKILQVGILLFCGQIETVLYPISLLSGQVNLETPTPTTKIVEPFFETRSSSIISLDTGSWQEEYEMVLV